MKAVQSQLDDLREQGGTGEVEYGGREDRKQETVAPKTADVRVETSMTPTSGQLIQNCFTNSKLKIFEDSKKPVKQLSVTKTPNQDQGSNLEDTYLKLRSLFETMQSVNSRLMEDYQTIQDRIRLSSTEDQSLMRPLMVDLVLLSCRKY